jgi:hypothetical protein
MRIRTHRAILLALLLLLPLAPAGADSGGSLKDLATVVETVARDISVTTVLMLAYERLDQPEDAGKAKQKIRELLQRERQALNDLERRLDGEPPAPEPIPVDETLERIRTWADAEIPLFKHEFLTDIIRDDKHELRYREAAAEALCGRFKSLPQDQRVNGEKEKVGRALLPRLMDTKADMRVVIARVFKQFWPGMYQRSGYDPTAVNFPVRYKAYKMWRQYLKD